jgi:serine-type D-Ala-D-Ala carboxypeptidase/endopeptidase (penicillin-binding protein 4)
MYNAKIIIVGLWNFINISWQNNYVCALLLIATTQSIGQNTQQIVQQLLNDPFYHRSHIGLAVRDIVTNELVVSHNEQKLYVPASTLKLITNFSARSILGSDYVYETSINYDGHIDSMGTLHGNIYIRGSGDPTLGSTYPASTLSADGVVSSIITQIRGVGIKSIDGFIISDASVFESDPIAPSWQWNDIGSYYAAGAWGINIRDNSYNIYFHRDGPEGMMTSIAYWEPYIPDLRIDNSVIIDNAANEDLAYIIGGPQQYHKKAVGTLPQGKNMYKVKGALPDPPLFIAYQVYQGLTDYNVTSRGYKTQNGPDYQSIGRTTIATFTSPSLDHIVRLSNERSINLYSESLLKTLGKIRHGRGAGSQGIAEIKQHLINQGLDITGLHMEDGSGLSTRSLITPSLMAEYLRLIAQQEPIEQITRLIPLAGETGTVRNLLSNSPAKGNIWAKSGSMDKILCYAGYCKCKTGRMVSFSVMLLQINSMKIPHANFYIVLIALMSCKGDLYNNQSVIHSDDITTKNITIDSVTAQNNDRAIWQKPSLVIDKLGDISNATIADIGAGAGYFSFRMASKSKKVLAIDIEEKALKYIDSLKQSLPNDIGIKVQTRLAKVDDPMLKAKEVDIIVIINTIAYIQDFPAYLLKLKKSLRSGGRIMIIDYKMKRLPINAPPKDQRVYLDKVEDMLTNAGFDINTSDDTSLDYQYIIVGEL